MRASALQQHTRCTVVCRNADTGDIVRCARWANHVPSDEHMEYREVIEQMCEAIAAIRAHDELNTFGQFVVVQEARAWYKKLVLNV